MPFGGRPVSMLRMLPTRAGLRGMDGLSFYSSLLHGRRPLYPFPCCLPTSRNVHLALSSPDPRSGRTLLLCHGQRNLHSSYLKAMPTMIPHQTGADNLICPWSLTRQSARGGYVLLYHRKFSGAGELLSTGIDKAENFIYSAAGVLADIGQDKLCGV